MQQELITELLERAFILPPIEAGASARKDVKKKEGFLHNVKR